MRYSKENLFVKRANVKIDDNTKDRYIVGVIPYNQKSVDLGGFTEVITDTAFNKTLRDNSDVKLLWNHNTDRVLGSTKSGTLELESKEDGLYFRCKVGTTSFANDSYEVIARGDVDTLSFGFLPVKTENKSGVRYLREVKLEEISCGVPFPAYPTGKVETQLRGFCMRNDLDEEKVEEVFNKVNSGNEEINVDLETVKNLIEVLRGFLPKEKSTENKPQEEAVEQEQSKDTQKDDDTSEEEKKKQEELKNLENLVELELI